ncbi:hypothetical protein DFH06DRAFT_625267 [Mycena polygramma]|nr:hypothetical protein DFH06DRAFT_625267 [Mycena polygramma]
MGSPYSNDQWRLHHRRKYAHHGDIVRVRRGADAGRRTHIYRAHLHLHCRFIATWAVVIRMIASEMQPKRTRAAASSLAQCFGWTVNWVITFSTPLFLHRSKSGPYFLFGSFALLTVLVCAVFQLETKGFSLDVLDQGFQGTKLQSAVKWSRRASPVVYCSSCAPGWLKVTQGLDFEERPKIIRHLLIWGRYPRHGDTAA